jgi:hypothetical protein
VLVTDAALSADAAVQGLSASTRGDATAAPPPVRDEGECAPAPAVCPTP